MRNNGDDRRPMTDDRLRRTGDEARASAGAWKVVGASVAGTSHLRAELPCQDAYLISYEAGGGLLIAVADGAGSAPRSGEGAHRAVGRSLAALKVATQQPPQDESGWREAMALAFAEAREALVNLAESEGEPLPAFSTTLTCVAAVDGWLAVGQIGDGAVVFQEEDGTLYTAVQPHRGEYANETRFVTSPGALDFLEVRALAQEVRALAVTTDGLLKLALLMPDYVPHPPFFDPLLKWVAQMESATVGEEELSAFLASERVSARTSDDKTLVLATRRLPPAGDGLA